MLNKMTDSDEIATLQKGQLLTPLAEAVGQQTWYMVKTPHGLVGWVRAIDVSAGDQLRQAFKEQSQRSSWSARTTTGRTIRRQLDGGTCVFSGQSVRHLDIGRRLR